jgi:TrmH family RNA methyltransferase
VAEGPRLVAAALDHGSRVETVYAALDAPDGTDALVRRARAAGIAVRLLAPGVADRIGDTVTTQGVFALVATSDADADALLRAADFVVVAERVSDPGNAGTLWRSVAAAGGNAIVLGAGSVDAYNPKLVRASAGACFSVPVIDGADVAAVLETCRERGLQRVGAVVEGGAPPEAVDLAQPCALVLGHEARGLGHDLPFDVTVTIPMAPRAESVNLAMAGSILCFEVARQRRAAPGAGAAGR